MDNIAASRKNRNRLRDGLLTVKTASQWTLGKTFLALYHNYHKAPFFTLSIHPPYCFALRAKQFYLSTCSVPVYSSSAKRFSFYFEKHHSLSRSQNVGKLPQKNSETRKTTEGRSETEKLKPETDESKVELFVVGYLVIETAWRKTARMSRYI